MNSQQLAVQESRRRPKRPEKRSTDFLDCADSPASTAVRARRKFLSRERAEDAEIIPPVAINPGCANLGPVDSKLAAAEVFSFGDSCPFAISLICSTAQLSKFTYSIGPRPNSLPPRRSPVPPLPPLPVVNPPSSICANLWISRLRALCDLCGF